MCEAKDFGQKQNKIRQNFIKTESIGPSKNLFKYGELSLKFWAKFAKLPSIFHGMNEC